jgi:DNA-binding transcriptional LysR family regulator
MALLERDGRTVRLTHAARRLVVRADRVLAELDAAESELAAEHGGVRGEVVIGAFPSAAAHLVAPAVRALHAQHPELRCLIREHEPEDGIPLLRAGELDLLISEGYDDVDPAPVGGLEPRLLLTEPLLLVSDAPRREPVDLGTLADADWIGGSEQFGGAVERALQAAGFTPRIAHRADEAAVFQALAAAGLGVALLPRLACSDAPGVHYARVLPEPPRRHITALLRRGAAARPALAALLDALVLPV